MHRRRYLALIGGVAGLAGCGGLPAPLGPEPKLAESGWATEDRSTAGTTTTITIDGMLPPHRYGLYQLNPTYAVDIEISITVESGGAMDLFTMDDDEFDRFRDGDSVSLYTDFSKSNVTKTTVSGTLSGGKYAIIFDNSRHGEATPDGELAFTAELVASFA